MILTVGALKKELAQFSDEYEVQFQKVMTSNGDFISVELGGLKSRGDICLFEWG